METGATLGSITIEVPETPEITNHNIIDPVEPIVPETMTINKMLITQMQHEMINNRTYLNFAGICDVKGLLGASKFFRKQANDELKHFDLIFDYCCDRIGFIPELLDVPSMKFDTNKFLQDMIWEALNLEITTTRALSIIKKQAIYESDYLTDSFLDQMIIEQREEEKTLSDIYNRCMMFGDTPAGIMLLDQELGL